MGTNGAARELQEWMEKLKKSKTNEADLSRDEDLSIAIMNLISLEEHFYFTAMKTGNGSYLELLDEVRKKRIQFLKKIVRDPKGEEWCISKHLLAASMRLFEVGTKELSVKGKDAAMPFFQSGFDLWSMFFCINLGMIEAKDMNQEALQKEHTRTGKLSEMMKNIINCCKEW
ncbi:TPA: hypothetical protein HA361_01490 [Candidatus Woesearchaeota archaeon]|nr:hypothetical protein [Candidatus Woesearchaeota archaeon]HII68972.1 hypothetical protein [Candidatus Woesearchaeota archaeon]